MGQFDFSVLQDAVTTIMNASWDSRLSQLFNMPAYLNLLEFTSVIILLTIEKVLILGTFFLNI